MIARMAGNSARRRPGRRRALDPARPRCLQQTALRRRPGGVAKSQRAGRRAGAVSAGPALCAGEGVLRSAADAAACYRRAAEAGHAEAAFHLGLICLNGADPFKGPSQGWFRAIAARDDEAARGIRDALFPNGVGVEKDIEAALRWLARASAAGLPEAQAVLGDLRRGG